MDFRSDNVSGAHPAILEALIAANRGGASPYGDDAWTTRLQARFSEVFEREVAVLPVVTGTAANALSLALCSPAWGAVYCHAFAHVNVSECGAPEFFSGGAKLVAVPDAQQGAADSHGAPGSQGPAGPQGKIDAAAVEHAIHREGAVHAVQPAAVSISQASEAGTVYRRAELEALSEAAKRHGMLLHMDGARFAQALVALEASPAELTWKAGVDVLAFGATKNGCPMAEAVVLFDPARARELAFRRKRAGHLLSKLRFISAQLEAYLHDDLWLSNARHSHAQAARLAAGLTAAGFTLAASCETNQLFVELPATVAAGLRARGFDFYDWPTLGPLARRLITAFDTRPEDVDAFISAARSLAQGTPG